MIFNWFISSLLFWSKKLVHSWATAFIKESANKIRIIEGANRIINKQEFNTGNTLLIYAVENNLKSIVESLLLKGANPNIQNKFGNSALHIAYKNDNYFLINLLIEYHADKELKNNKDFLPNQM